MSSPTISLLTKAINKPDNFKTRKSLRIDFGSAGTTVIYQKGKVMCFRMYCNLLNRFVAVKCYTDSGWNKNSYLEKISKWHNRNTVEAESPVFLYLQEEFEMQGYYYDIVISEWNDNKEAIYFYDIENSVKIIDNVAFSADMTRLIAFPDPTTNIKVESYSIPQGVITIGVKAFEACTQIYEVIIPNTVTTIEDFAFFNSYHIQSLIIPDTVTYIGTSAFSMIRINTFHIPVNVKITGDFFCDCPELMTITLGENHPYYIIVDNVLFSHDKKQLLRYPPAKLDEIYDVPDGVEVIGEYAFSGCCHLSDIKIPDSVVKICDFAFEATAIKTVIFPPFIDFIGSGIFENCNILEAIDLPLKITKINSCMFYKCNGLKSFTIPNHIIAIESNAFSFCENLAEINIPNSVESIGVDAFIGCKKLNSVIIPQSVKSMELSVFAGCDELEEIQFYGDLPVIEESTFENCSNLKTILFPKGLTRIDKNAFSECNELKSIVIPEGVTEIDINAFFFCAELHSVVLPKSLLSIGINAFRFCEKLVNIDLPRNVTFIGDAAFNGCENLNYGFKLALTNRFGERVLGEEED